jgi:SRSO17 transposase
MTVPDGLRPQKLFPVACSLSPIPTKRLFQQTLHIGLISAIKIKTLPAIAREVGLENKQGLHPFLTSSPWLAKALKQRRLKVILSGLGAREIPLIMDETGDKKKGKTTDYVRRQYTGNLGKVENGIVSVNAYGLIDISKCYNSITISF